MASGTVDRHLSSRESRHGETLPEVYPVSSWADCDEALTAAAAASVELRRTPPARLGAFLRKMADRIEARAAAIIERAHLETGLPKSPRLTDAEMPRTLGQLRQAAAAAEDGSWALPTIDVKGGIRSYLAPLGPVCVFGPNNFRWRSTVAAEVISSPRSPPATRSSARPTRRTRARRR